MHVTNNTEDLLWKWEEQVQVNPLPLSRTKFITTGFSKPSIPSPSTQLGLFLSSMPLKTWKTLKFLGVREKNIDSKLAIQKVHCNAHV